MTYTLKTLKPFDTMTTGDLETKFTNRVPIVLMAAAIMHTAGHMHGDAARRHHAAGEHLLRQVHPGASACPRSCVCPVPAFASVCVRLGHAVPALVITAKVSGTVHSRGSCYCCRRVRFRDARPACPSFVGCQRTVLRAHWMLRVWCFSGASRVCL